MVTKEQAAEYVRWARKDSADTMGYPGRRKDEALVAVADERDRLAGLVAAITALVACAPVGSDASCLAWEQRRRDLLARIKEGGP